MDFRTQLQRAKAGNKNDCEHIFLSYRPLLLKYSMVNQRFDEDLYQELSKTLLKCIIKFSIQIE